MKSDHYIKKNRYAIKKLVVLNISDPSPGFLLTGYIERSSEYISDDHSHDFWQIIIVTGGSLKVSFGTSRHELSAGWTHILKPGDKHILQSGPDGYSQVGIDVKPDSPFGKTLAECFSTSAVIRSTDAERLGQVIHDNIKSRVAASEKLIAGCVESAVWALTAEMQRSSIDPAARKISEYIDLHLSEHISLETVSGELFLSVPHLERICRKNYDCGIISLLNECRFERASSYLLATGMTVGEIAEMVGFDNLSNFSAFFKHRAGVSPRVYRGNRK